MKRLFLLHTILCFFIGSISAQTKDSTYKFTLQQSIDYAYEHQNDMLNAKLDEDIANSQVNEIRGAGLPQLTGSFDLKDFKIIPTSVFPIHVFYPSAPIDALEAFPFGLKYTSTAALNASQLIFDPSFIVGLQAAKSVRELSQKNTVRTKIDVAVAVSKAYYNVLVSNARIELINANVERIQKLRDDTKAMYDNGFAEKIDFDRVTLAYNNVVTEKENVVRLVQLSNSLLKYQMGLNINSVLTLTDSLNPELVKNISVPADQPDVSKRIEYSILQTNKRLHYLDAKRYKEGYIPSIFAYGGLNTNAYRPQLDIFDKSTPWYPTELIGATLTWNIFDGRQKHYKAQQATLEMRKTENDIANLENGLNLEVSSSKAALQNALASFKTQEENLNLANEVSSVSKIKYEQGVGSNIEVIDAETSLKEAQTNYYNALYDALVAKIDLDKALGNIK